MLSAHPLPPGVSIAYSGPKATAAPSLPLLSTGPAQQRPANTDGGHWGGHTPESCYLQGEVGQSKLSHFVSLEDAKKDFEKKFRDKTKNSWAEREYFVAHPGKYTLIDVQREDKVQEAVVKVKWPGREGGPGPRVGLNSKTQLIGLCHCPAMQPQAQASQLWPQSG